MQVSAISSLIRRVASGGGLPSASSMKAVGELMTRAATPVCSVDASSAPSLCMLALIFSCAARAAAGAVATLVRVQLGLM